MAKVIVRAKRRKATSSVRRGRTQIVLGVTLSLVSIYLANKGINCIQDFNLGNLSTNLFTVGFGTYFLGKGFTNIGIVK